MTTSLTGKAYSERDKMRNLLDDNPHLLPALSRFGIALGFGDATVEDVCAEAGVDTSTFLAVSNLISGKTYSHLKVDVSALKRYLRNAHKYFTDYVLPAIRRKLVEAISTSAGTDLSVVMLRFFDKYVEEMRESICHEEIEILEFTGDVGSLDFRKSLETFQEHHHLISDKLREMKDILICHYQADTARTDLLNALLFEIMTFERDMLSHCEVEDLLFVPAILGINVTKPFNGDNYKSPLSEESELDANGDVRLTPRERDIVRAIARGLSNKEIAEAFFLSVHTVTTHRRNISSKLGIHSASGMTLYAILHGLISLEEGQKLIR